MTIYHGGEQNEVTHIYIKAKRGSEFKRLYFGLGQHGKGSRVLRTLEVPVPYNRFVQALVGMSGVKTRNYDYLLKYPMDVTSIKLVLERISHSVFAKLNALETSAWACHKPHVGFT